jgi:hypothetical protein
MALSVAKTVQFFNSTEGKDKQLKVIQFTCRALSDVAGRFLGYKELEARLVSLWKAILVARNITWFGKWLNEYQTVATLANEVESAKTEQQKTIANMTRTCRFFFMLRWAFENIKILGFVGVFKSIDGAPKGVWNKRAKTVWLFALGFGITAEFLRLRMNNAEREALKMVPSCSSAELWHQTAPPELKNATEEEIEEMKAKKAKLSADRTKSIKQIVAFCGDSVVASHVVTLPEKLGLWQGGYSELTVGLGGMTASLIQSHNLWPA